MAERSIEQTRKAFEGFPRRAAGHAANTIQTGAKSTGACLLTYSEQNVNTAFELPNKVVSVKVLQEAVALQGKYLKSQLAVLQTWAKEFGEVLQKSVALLSR